MNRLAIPAIVFALCVSITPGQAQRGADIAGTWTGTVFQNKGQSGYAVEMRLTEQGGETSYPGLKCAGTLTRAGAAAGYTFFVETITRGGHDTGGSCINGTITVTRDGDKLGWGWVGRFQGETYTAWSTLSRKN